MGKKQKPHREFDLLCSLLFKIEMNAFQHSSLSTIRIFSSSRMSIIILLGYLNIFFFSLFHPFIVIVFCSSFISHAFNVSKLIISNDAFKIEIVHFPLFSNYLFIYHKILHKISLSFLFCLFPFSISHFGSEKISLFSPFKFFINKIVQFAHCTMHMQISPVRRFQFSIFFYFVCSLDFIYYTYAANLNAQFP